MTQWVKRGCTWHRTWKNRIGPEKDRRGELAATGTGSSGADAHRFRTRRTSAKTHPPLSRGVVDVPRSSGVSPTNNLAEQALRALVILRKLTFGSRTRAGAKRLGTMMTVIETAKRQGKSVLKFLVALFTMDSNRRDEPCIRASDRP